MLFESTLEKGGVLVFTTAGNPVADMIRTGDLGGINQIDATSLVESFDAFGFGFANYVDFTSKYGRALAHPSWVCSLLRNFPTLKLSLYSEALWANRQDVYGCVKITAT